MEANKQDIKNKDLDRNKYKQKTQINNKNLK